MRHYVIQQLKTPARVISIFLLFLFEISLGSQLLIEINLEHKSRLDFKEKVSHFNYMLL